MSEIIIKAENAVIRQQKNTILKSVSLEIKSGEFIYLIGKVGSGKSSFLKTLYAELPLDYGHIDVAGFPLKKIRKSQIPLLRRKCGIVFQDFKLLTDRNVFSNLEFVLKATGWKNKNAIRERIHSVLEKVEMPDSEKKMPHELSGGEQQRIVLARALLNAPPLILADEPTGNIDPSASYKLAELFQDLCHSGKTVIIATHQYDLLEKYPGRVFRCENGAIIEDADLSAPSGEVMEEIETITEEAILQNITPLGNNTPKETVEEEKVPENDADKLDETDAPSTDTDMNDELPEEVFPKPEEEAPQTEREQPEEEKEEEKNDAGFLGFELIQ